MEQLKAYKFRMYPDNDQKILINKTFGCTRYLYNHFLNKKQEQYKQTKKSQSAYDNIKEIPELAKERPWLSEVDSCALRSSIFDLEDAFKRVYNKQNNYPNFKSKFAKNSYRTNNIISEYKGKTYNSIKLDPINKTIKLPKLKDIKIRGYRNQTNIEGTIINATISRETDNRYYVSVLIRQELSIKPIQQEAIIGIDLGIKDLIVTSDNEKYENPKALIKYEKRIKHLQKELARKEKGSNNYNKLKQKIAIIYRKIRNTRKYYLHQITKEITDTKSIIVTETLKIKNMLKNHKLAKLIQDASWSELIRQLGYKSRWKGKRFYQIEANYPSSQICSRCDYQNKETKNLGIREIICPSCGNEYDRDFNAAINIMSKGLERYMTEIN